MADVPPEDRARNVLVTHWNDDSILGSLVKSAIAATVDKQGKDGIDFEIQTFMDSIFWEKLAEGYRDVMANAERVFGLGPTRWMTMHLLNAILLFVFLETIIISECYRMETPLYVIDRKAKEYAAII
jgi:DNA-binding ferritin-like protein (Dps family)